MVGAFCRFFDRRSAKGLLFLVQGNMVLILFQRIMIFFLRATCCVSKERQGWILGCISYSSEPDRNA